ncbi:MAG: phosphoribulokinase [Euzebya sp.]
MPDKKIRIRRAKQQRDQIRRPVMLAVAGDSAAGKTTLVRGLVQALGEDRSTGICVDDYHRYDRAQRKTMPFTPLHPDCNYLDVMEQHLQLLASGEPILKPSYDHSTGELVRPEYVAPRDFVIVEGLLPLHSAVAQACFDITVYLDPPESIRHQWKISRDCADRGYSRDAVVAELERREPESEAFIRPQRARADIIVRFAPIPQRDDPVGTPLSAELALRPTIKHPDLLSVVGEDQQKAMHTRLQRDDDGRPVDAVHVHGYATSEDSKIVQKAIWDSIGHTDPLPESLGTIKPGVRSEPLAVTQLILLFHLLQVAGDL